MGSGGHDVQGEAEGVWLVRPEDGRLRILTHEHGQALGQDPKAVVGCPSLEKYKTWLDKTLSNLIQFENWPYFEQGVWLNDLQSSFPM